MRAIPVVAALLLALPASAPAATYMCDGFAPTVTSCSTGTRTRSSGLSHDVAADFDYVGTVESGISWNDGGKTVLRTWRCTYLGPMFQRTCISSGDFPPVGFSFTHRCRSLIPGTVGTGALNGVEGGVGPWQCWVSV